MLALCKQNRSNYPEDLAGENLADLKGLKLFVTPTAELMERALEIACAHRITAYDACYAALAEMKGIPLLTADDRLVEALGGSLCRIRALGDMNKPHLLPERTRQSASLRGDEQRATLH
ncbi:MAG: type II toxin-antitoxin system VapC family toxin [Armatimonadetes bacterium]|nr:type II toxin-antitoxin system VapC family toxin [Armatimonadota bacterium]